MQNIFSNQKKNGYGTHHMQKIMYLNVFNNIVIFKIQYLILITGLIPDERSVQFLIPAPSLVRSTVRPRFCPNNSSNEEYYYWASSHTRIFSLSLSPSLSFPHTRHSRSLSLSLSLSFSRVFFRLPSWTSCPCGILVCGWIIIDRS